MRLIDADRLMLFCETLLKIVGHGKRKEITGVSKEKIDAQPTIDAVPVIRCKDCKHYEQDFGNDWGVCCKWVINQIGFTVDKDGFCYKAERKEE